MLQTTSIKIDTLRVDKMISDLENRLTGVKSFVEDKTNKLIEAQDRFNNFIDISSCENLSIGNMYSTGFDKSEYTEESRMIAHCTMFTNKEVKNRELFCKKLQQKWNILFSDISADFHSYKIKYAGGGKLEIGFQIWI